MADKETATAKSEKYAVPKGEEKSIHALIQLKGFSPVTGKPLHKAYTQKYNQREWISILDNPGSYSIVKVLHLPEGSPTPEAHAKAKAEAAEKKKAK